MKLCLIFCAALATFLPEVAHSAQVQNPAATQKPRQEFTRIKNQNYPKFHLRGRNHVHKISVKQALHTSGDSILQNCSFGEFFSRGNSTIINTKVEGVAAGEGSLMAKGCLFLGNVKMRGTMTLIESEFKKDLSVIGTLYADSSDGTTLTITDDAVLKNAGFDTITIDSKKAVTITLLEQTIITGNITFKEHDGVVVGFDRAQITGSIINGSFEAIVNKE